jgi:hypothetical protein
MRDRWASLTIAEKKLRHAEAVNSAGGFDDVVIELCRKAKEESAQAILTRAGESLHCGRTNSRLITSSAALKSKEHSSN